MFKVETEGFEKSYGGGIQLEHELEVQEYCSVSATDSFHLVI